MNGYLFFDSVTPATRATLFELAEDGLLRLAGVTVSSGYPAFAAYAVPDLRAAYALIEAVTEAVGPPALRLAATGAPTAVPGTLAYAEPRAIAFVLLDVPFRSGADLAGRLAKLGLARAAAVVGGPVGVIAEVDGSDAGELEARLGEVLAAAGEWAAQADVLFTSSELGVGWGTG